MRILLADHRLKVRFALRALLEQRPGVEVVGETVGTEDLLAQVAVASPDLALLDWNLQSLPAIDLLPALEEFAPRLV
jgi:DNA-binding NarL/FixJ family response regulator